MQVEGIENSNTSQYVQNKSVLGKDEFLQLLITQLRHQDPLKPMEDREFIAQLAQFNSLEQMLNLNKNFENLLKWQQITQASSLIGKSITARVLGEEVSGIVSKVERDEGSVSLLVGDKKIKLEDIISVGG